MVATQSFSISRRSLDVEDYIDIGRRHAGWIAGPAFFGFVVSVCVAFALPNTYTSQATMQIRPAHITENMVQSVIANSLSQRIQTMETQIQSRAELSSIINDPRLQLYKEEIKEKPLEDVLDDMRQAIRFSNVNSAGSATKQTLAFNIEFSYKDRFKAQQTVTALISKFEEQIHNSQKMDQDTAKDFFSDMLQNAKAELSEANDKLTAFKEGNPGKLPEDVQTNIAREASFTAKIEGVMGKIAEDRRMIAQYQIARDNAQARLDLFDQDQAALESLSTIPGSPAAQQNQELATLEKDISELEFRIQLVQQTHNEKYPPLRAMQQQLDAFRARYNNVTAKINQKQAADAAQAQKSANAPKTLLAMKGAQQRSIIEQQLKGYQAQETSMNEDIARLEKQKADYQKESDDIERNLKEGTGIEAVYTQLQENLKMAQANYVELQKKNQIADENGQLIERKAGEELDVLDIANLPVAPAKPNRYLIIGAGCAISLILGFAMAGLQEARDTSLKNLKDVRAYTNLPVLCSIPLLENTMLVRRKRRLTYLAWASAVIIGAAAVSGAVVYYYQHTLGAGGA